MASSRSSLARMGQISPAAAAATFSNATLRQTRVQKSKMIDFSSKVRDEGDKDFDGHEHFSGAHINSPLNQRDRVGSMPKGGAAPRPKGTGKGAVGSAARSTSPQGGAVQASYVPGREQIDHFPVRQKAIWPRATGVKAGKGRGANTAMKGPIARTGGPRENYGGPNAQRN